ncbi:hypothetical protein TgHK011_003847 [Trichoderma gracile]|nr:hypothetical protein TgHK011_003847 [Trichoderma gracile]
MPVVFLSCRLSEIPQAGRHATLEIGLDIPRRAKFAVASAPDAAPEAGPGLALQPICSCCLIHCSIGFVNALMALSASKVTPSSPPDSQHRVCSRKVPGTWAKPDPLQRHSAGVLWLRALRYRIPPAVEPSPPGTVAASSCCTTLARAQQPAAIAQHKFLPVITPEIIFLLLVLNWPHLHFTSLLHFLRHCYFLSGWLSAFDICPSLHHGSQRIFSFETPAFLPFFINLRSAVPYTSIWVRSFSLLKLCMALRGQSPRREEGAGGILDVPRGTSPRHPA